MSWREIWSITRLGSKLSASVSPSGEEVGIGITNTLAMTGVSNSIDRTEARKLAVALLEFAGDAHLIAAAPALHAAVELLVQKFAAGDLTMGQTRAIAEACAALTKARAA